MILGTMAVGMAICIMGTVVDITTVLAMATTAA
jgi:hypothetical protein